MVGLFDLLRVASFLVISFSVISFSVISFLVISFLIISFSVISFLAKRPYRSSGAANQFSSIGFAASVPLPFPDMSMRYASESISTWLTTILTVATICLFAPSDAKPTLPVHLHWVLPTALSGYLP